MNLIQEISFPFLGFSNQYTGEGIHECYGSNLYGRRTCGVISELLHHCALMAGDGTTSMDHLAYIVF
jgi:hypothetical protein